MTTNGTLLKPNLQNNKICQFQPYLQNALQQDIMLLRSSALAIHSQFATRKCLEAPYPHYDH